ncbi:hypothetical protein [Nocardia blacklockiae]|uniref:hypothetical protein n=1 Tax=Nocardia blacklockiae TaxID=480036 RepID=UPI001893B3CD|nr:hypothetical protein [Nocardia blacklockiae]MBF6174266.1 hypothetical protein [Nocardia blacklockiae]
MTSSRSAYWIGPLTYCILLAVLIPFTSGASVPVMLVAALAAGVFALVVALVFRHLATRRRMPPR